VARACQFTALPRTTPSELSSSLRSRGTCDDPLLGTSIRTRRSFYHERANISIEKQKEIVHDLFVEGVPLTVQLIRILAILPRSEVFADLSWVSSGRLCGEYAMLPNAPAAIPSSAPSGRRRYGGSIGTLIASQKGEERLLPGIHRWSVGRSHGRLGEDGNYRSFIIASAPGYTGVSLST
jgi:hypothetical protein